MSYADDDSGDDDEAESLGFMDYGRGGEDESDADTCAECGCDLEDAYDGDSGGGRLCEDCDDMSDFGELEWL